jgi:hypothetical protein
MTLCRLFLTGQDIVLLKLPLPSGARADERVVYPLQGGTLDTLDTGVNCKHLF